MTTSARTTAIDPDLLPSDEEVAEYRRTGYYTSRRIVPDEVLDAAEAGMARFYAGDVDAPFPGSTAWDHQDWTPEHGAGLRKNDYTSLMVRELSGLVRLPVLAAVAARLSGADGIRLWHDQLLWKPSGVADGTANVGWHTDRQYWQCCTSTEMLTAWVPFHDCDETTGGVTFMEGSHRWDQEGLSFFDGDLAAQQARFTPGGEPLRAVTPTLARGQVNFHHCRTVHGSGPNSSGSPRRSMAIHLQPADNRHRPVGDDGGPTYHRNDELVRSVDGSPDYTDPRICPLLGGIDG
jgi:ectoine hydroxylase-related dioxygenase (phytanoyl-CoA dioxygenase family)